MNVTTTKQTEFSIRRIRPADGQTLQARLAPPARLFFCVEAARLMPGPFPRGAALRLSAQIVTKALAAVRACGQPFGLRLTAR